MVPTIHCYWMRPASWRISLPAKTGGNTSFYVPSLRMESTFLSPAIQVRISQFHDSLPLVVFLAFVPQLCSSWSLWRLVWAMLFLHPELHWWVHSTAVNIDMVLLNVGKNFEILSDCEGRDNYQCFLRKFIIFVQSRLGNGPGTHNSAKSVLITFWSATYMADSLIDVRDSDSWWQLFSWEGPSWKSLAKVCSFKK